MFSAPSTVIASPCGNCRDQSRFPTPSYLARTPGVDEPVEGAPVRKTEPPGPKATASPTGAGCAQSRLPALSYLARKAGLFVTLTLPKLAALVYRLDRIALPP